MKRKPKGYHLIASLRAMREAAVRHDDASLVEAIDGYVPLVEAMDRKPCPENLRAADAHFEKLSALMDAFDRRLRCGVEYKYHGALIRWPGLPVMEPTRTTTCSLPRGHAGPHSGEEKT